MGRVGPEILGRLFDEHAAALVLYARQWCESAEDVVQEAFLSQRGSEPRPIGSSRGYTASLATALSRQPEESGVGANAKHGCRVGRRGSHRLTTALTPGAPSHCSPS